MQSLPAFVKNIMPITRILLGVDFSEPSVRAFKFAAELAQKSKTTIHILHVIEAQPVTPGWLPAGGLSEMMLLLEEKAKAAMDSLIGSNSQELRGLTVTTEIDDGYPLVEILHRARELSVDLIVVGAKGLASVDEVVTGGTAENLVRRATCSVLVVR